MNSFNFYLTSLEPNIEQNILSQSIGGYCSLSTLYPTARLGTSVVGLYDTSFNISDKSENFKDLQYISINNEMMKVLSFDDNENLIEIDKRGHNNIIGMHVQDDNVFAVSNSDIFNDVFDEHNNQYRCICVKNESDNIFKNIKIFLFQNSRNINSNIQIAVEIPKSQYIKSESTSRTYTELTDDSLIGEYSDNYFSECFLKPEGEIGGIVKEFKSSTGTFVFYDSFSNVIDNKEYEIFPSPSHRLRSGAYFSEDNSISSFYNAQPTSPFVVDNVVLSPNDVIYLWIKRHMLNIAEPFHNNNFVVNISFEESS